MGNQLICEMGFEESGAEREHQKGFRGERKNGSWVGEELLRKAIRVDKRTESKKGSRESLLYTSLRRP